MALPAPWNTSDVGARGRHGQLPAIPSPTFTVTGAGTRYSKYRGCLPLLSISRSAGIAPLSPAWPACKIPAIWSKAGVMMRADLTAGAANAFMLVTPGNGANSQFRTRQAGAPAMRSNDGHYARPSWVKIVRSGSNFSCYYSSDGSTWTQCGSTTAITMTDPIYVGLAVCSHADPALCTATFDNVSVTEQQCATPTSTRRRAPMAPRRRSPSAPPPVGRPCATPPMAARRARPPARCTAVR